VGDGQGILVDGHVGLDEDALLAVDGGPNVVFDELQGLINDLAAILSPDETEARLRFEERSFRRYRRGATVG